jgi:type I thyroxine 5'-deiodinase
VNVKEKIVFNDPTTIEERRKAAKDFATQFKVSLPILVDTLDDKLEGIFAAWPDRIYVLDRDGKVAYKGKPGPFGFKVKDAEAALKKLLTP